MYAEPIAGGWSPPSPYVNDLRVSNNYTYDVWQERCEDACCQVNESSGTWQKVFNFMHLLTMGNRNSLSMPRGTTAVGEYGLALLKNISIDSLKPLIIRLKIAEW